MSPNEEQLRAALRQGEGERPNSDLVIASAHAARRSRRRMVWAVAGSVAVVIAIGGGITALTLHSGNSTSAGAGAGAPQMAPSPTSAGGAAAPARPGTGSPPALTGALACPIPPATIAMPSASNGRLFPDRITAIRICLYQAGTPKFAGMTEVTGTGAEQLARRLEDSPLPAPKTACTADLGPTVVILANTATGKAPTVVGNLGGCGEITNGQAARLARAVLQDEARVILQKPGPPGLNSPGPGPS